MANYEIQNEKFQLNSNAIHVCAQSNDYHQKQNTKNNVIRYDERKLKCRMELNKKHDTTQIFYRIKENEEKKKKGKYT